MKRDTTAKQINPNLFQGNVISLLLDSEWKYGILVLQYIVYFLISHFDSA